MGKIKLIILDLDGVLVDTREMHYEALNAAIKNVAGDSFVIKREEHLSTYDGLPTTKKLHMLTKNKGLPEEHYNKIWENKQKETASIIRDTWGVDRKMLYILWDLWKSGYKLCCASNSIRETTKLMLHKRGFLDYIDFYISNQDVESPKPSSEMYLKCMILAGVSPAETVIVEDSHIGRLGAAKTGAYVCPVKDYNDFCSDKIFNFLKNIEENGKGIDYPKWLGGTMNVLIPMAGRGSRFENAGYTFPKPLVEVNGNPMIQTVVENLNIDAKYTFIVQESHYTKYNLKYLLNLIAPNCNIVKIDGITEGAACTTLLAKEFIDNDEPLIIANSDQFVEWDSNTFMYSMIADTIDAGILTFRSTHPKWSFAKLNDDGFVSEVAEKKPISDIATVGIYYWKRGSDYVKYAEQMIQKNIRVNDEFYVCPVFNEAIQDNKKVKTFDIEKMWGLGTPEDLEAFLKRGKQ